METWKDVLLDSTGDAAVMNGDLVTGYSFNQESAIITYGVPGNWKQDPIIGADISNIIKI